MYLFFRHKCKITKWFFLSHFFLVKKIKPDDGVLDTALFFDTFSHQHAYPKKCQELARVKWWPPPHTHTYHSHLFLRDFPIFMHGFFLCIAIYIVVIWNTPPILGKEKMLMAIRHFRIPPLPLLSRRTHPPSVAITTKNNYTFFCTIFYLTKYEGGEGDIGVRGGSYLHCQHFHSDHNFRQN